MLISFIVTVEDSKTDSLKTCIESIIRLSLRPDEREIIVVDDGSESCIINQLDGLADSVIYVRQKHLVRGMAKNLGMRMAEGQHILFLDGEDQLINVGFEHCIDIIRYNSPDIVLFDTTGNKGASSTYYIPEPVDGAQYMKHNDVSPGLWRYIFNRRILHDLRFIPDRMFDDIEFTPQLLLRAERVYSTNIAACLCGKPKRKLSAGNDKRKVVKMLNDMEQALLHLHDVAVVLPPLDFQALQRRTAQITLDYLLLIIKTTHSPKQLKERIERLERVGLFPLPDKDYTKRYIAMRTLVNSRITRKIVSLLAR